MADWTRVTAVTALAQLPGVGPVRLDQLLRAGDPVDLVAALRAGSPPPPGLGRVDEADRWAAMLHAIDPGALEARLADLDITVTTAGEAGHPSRLADDIDPSPVLFRRGRPLPTASPTVAVVGTRRCSAIGREVARELGHGLASAGVVVVSGLALGVDGAAHAGALAAQGAPPVAFVGGGPDIVYPRRHGDLWHRLVAEEPWRARRHLAPPRPAGASRRATA